MSDARRIAEKRSFGRKILTIRMMVDYNGAMLD